MPTPSLMEKKKNLILGPSLLGMKMLYGYSGKDLSVRQSLTQGQMWETDGGGSRPKRHNHQFFTQLRWWRGVRARSDAAASVWEFTVNFFTLAPTFSTTDVIACGQSQIFCSLHPQFISTVSKILGYNLMLPYCLLASSSIIFGYGASESPHVE